MKKICLYLLSLITAFSLAAPVYASNVNIVEDEDNGTVLIGEFTDNIDIEFNNEYFFKEDIMNPGDVWESYITLKNNSDQNMQISLVEIKNVLEDSLLFDALKIEIYLDDGIVYKGNYNNTTSRIFDWVDFPMHSEIKLKVITAFPGECDNAYQGKRFEADWIFEARCAEKTINEITDEKTQTGDESKAGAYGAVFLCAAAGLTVLLLINKKDKGGKENEEK